MSDTVLVTGGAGYVGSHACKALAAAGYRPVTYDNLQRGHRWAVKWGPFEEGDLRDAARLADVIRRTTPVAVFHFADLLRIEESIHNPALYWRNNVVGSLNLAEACYAGGVPFLVYSSTAAVYGLPEQLPIPESHPLRPISAYGSTKLAVERCFRDFQAAGGAAFSALRYFNAAGSDPEGEIGEAHTPKHHLIPMALEVALGTRDVLRIFGEDYDTPDGTCVRDYVHVSDLARAHLSVLERLKAGGEGGIWNLASGRGFSVRQVLESVRRVTGHPLPTVSAPRRPGDPPALVADARLAEAELGFVTEHRDLDEIVAHDWAWAKALHQRS